MTLVGSKQQHLAASSFPVDHAPTPVSICLIIGRRLQHLKGLLLSHHDWTMVIDFHSWLYSLFVGQDACFKQKARQRKHDDIDPQLSNGLGLFVDQAKYSTFLNSAKDQNEVSHRSLTLIDFLIWEAD